MRSALLRGQPPNVLSKSKSTGGLPIKKGCFRTPQILLLIVNLRCRNRSPNPRLHLSRAGSFFFRVCSNSLRNSSADPCSHVLRGPPLMLFFRTVHRCDTGARSALSAFRAAATSPASLWHPNPTPMRDGHFFQCSRCTIGSAPAPSSLVLQRSQCPACAAVELSWFPRLNRTPRRAVDAVPPSVRVRRQNHTQTSGNSCEYSIVF